MGMHRTPYCTAIHKDTGLRVVIYMIQHTHEVQTHLGSVFGFPPMIFDGQVEFETEAGQKCYTSDHDPAVQVLGDLSSEPIELIKEKMS